MYNCPICENPLRVTIKSIEGIKGIVHGYYCKTCNRDFSEDIECSKRGSINDRLLETQDFMDSACYDLIKQFFPDAPWNIAEIGEIRDALIETLKQRGLHEYDLYPWILTEYET